MHGLSLLINIILQAILEDKYDIIAVILNTTRNDKEQDK
ncbi:hypothetical protein lbkm_3525 [Lachnospiraceae bacterium KM106-2]|nr:hypothetical protein lbkm_3525 [Lachnospiraceae bacterium KM106-2]